MISPSLRASALALGVVLLLAACTSSNGDLAADVQAAAERARERGAGPNEQIPTEGCGDLQQPTLQEGSHLIGDREPPVPYSSTPPTSGWHASGNVPAGVVDEPLSEPQIVSVLERGEIVVAYAPDQTSDDTVAELVDLTTGLYAGRMTLTPYEPAMPTSLAFLAYGTLQRCVELDTDALSAFVLEQAGKGVPH